MNDSTNFRAISNFVGDCWQYFGVDVGELASDANLIYQLLSLVDEICDKHIEG